MANKQSCLEVLEDPVVQLVATGELQSAGLHRAKQVEVNLGVLDRFERPQLLHPAVIANLKRKERK